MGTLRVGLRNFVALGMSELSVIFLCLLNTIYVLLYIVIIFYYIFMEVAYDL